MRIGRVIPPAAAPLCWSDLWRGAAATLFPERSRRALADDIRKTFGVDHVFLVSSGTAALTLTFMGLRSLSAKTEVVLPAYTCFTVPAAALKAGLRPVLCDIDPATLDFDHALLEQSLTPNTLCVVTHHLFGMPSDVARVRRACEPRGIFVIEDAAQAMGGRSHRRRLGTLGDAGIFSLGRGKNITCGSGGIIVTNSGALAAAIAPLYEQLPASPLAEAVDFARLAVMTAFIRPELYWIPSALPFLGLGRTVFPARVPLRRLSGMKAGILRRWRARLVRSNRARAKTAAYFAARLPLGSAQARRPYLRLPVLAGSSIERDRLHAQSRERGLGLAPGYPTPISDIPEVRPVCAGKSFPAARRVAERLLTLPTHPWVSEGDKRRIAALCGELRTA